MNAAFWRKWHRSIAFPASIFLLFAAKTGVGVAITEFVGEEEALREAARTMTSPVRTDTIASGEAFGDGGLVAAMMWGTVLAFLTISGFVIYLTMRRRNPTAWQRVF